MNIKNGLQLFLVFSFLCAPNIVLAETLVLIQGYLGRAENWHDSGITRALEAAGWADGGQLFLTPRGVQASMGKGVAPKKFFTLDLPTQAPLLIQSRSLEQYLDYLRKLYPDNSLVLVGHSAGGVLGRLYMVQHPDSGVALLITIASPHRGTESAELGLLAGQSPLAWLGPMIGIDTLNRSQGVYHDLMREQPNNLLGWLNYQPHPPATYISIVHDGDKDMLGLGELIVPAWSQDMNLVPALRGRVQTIRRQGGHALNLDDGRALVQLLNRLLHHT